MIVPSCNRTASAADADQRSPLPPICRFCPGIVDSVDARRVTILHSLAELFVYMVFVVSEGGRKRRRKSGGLLCKIEP